MGKIHVLSTEISNKIAAGEVVERPSSVVKELVENGIDAGATAITVEIKNGGCVYIRVTDNGSGMTREDAEVAFLRHATSKIGKAEDLDAIYTLGFRGEALSSIGAVAEVDLYTKRKEDPLGVHVVCKGGEIYSSEEAGCMDGTTFVVQNLFYNTPARMKFLKKDATEAGYISDLMIRFILAYPEISFQLINNGKQQLMSPGDSRLENCVYTVYGRDYAKAMLEVAYEGEGVGITGAVGKGTLARPNRNFQSFFVNKRYIKSPLIMKAVEEAYKNQIMIGKFPVAVLNLVINPALIDINVHPTKLEVKFSNEKQIYEAVYYGVKNALYALPNVPAIEMKQQESAFEREGGKEQLTLERLARGLPKLEHNPRVNPFLKQETSPAMEEKKPLIQKEQSPAVTKEDVLSAFLKKDSPAAGQAAEPPAAFSPVLGRQAESEAGRMEDVDFGKEIQQADQRTAPVLTRDGNGEAADQKEAERIPQERADQPIQECPAEMFFRVAGQVFETYILAERGNELLLIDQHAAHERIKYEELKQAIAQKTLYPQILLEPVVVTVSPAEKASFAQNQETLEELGFETEEFGDREILVRTSPPDVEWTEVEETILELLAQLEAHKKEIIGARKERALYTVACKSAVKANHALNFKEMEALVRAVLNLENINTCPHGRPIIISMTKKELEKQFKRIL